MYPTLHRARRRSHGATALRGGARKLCRRLHARAAGRLGPAARDLAAWSAQLAASHALAAECDGALAGFATRRPADVLDLLYVSPHFQRRGVASALCDRLEAACAADSFRTMTVHASRTARPFFEQRGYRVLAEQQVERRGVTLTNFRMEKTLDQVR